jgi:Ser/Thr protein kinase RdoA (MazF antagonist)
MENTDILSVLNSNYPIVFKHTELFRDSGSAAYIVSSDSGKYFLKISKPAFGDTIKSSVYINVFLQNNNFPVPKVIFTAKGLPFVESETESGVHYYILYDYLEGSEINVKQDAAEIGSLLGRLHQVMSGYQGNLVTHDKEFYISRYLDILKKKAYPKASAFEKYGNELWNKVKDLPLGFSHGDMYSGNFQRSPEGILYILDFDTSCKGFPMYDLALICNRTNYFKFQKNGYQKTAKIYEQMLPEYVKINPLSKYEIDSLYDMITLYHFALQATIIEFLGLDSFNRAFFDSQLDWLLKWKEQCEIFANPAKRDSKDSSASPQNDKVGL